MGVKIQNLLYKVFVTFLIAGVAYFAAQHDVTMYNVTKAFAAMPLALVLFLVVIDYGVDTSKFYNRLISKNIAAALGAVVLLFATVSFITYSMITFNISTIVPEVAVVSAAVAILVLVPKTGTSEWVFWLWLASNIATMFNYITILPGGGVL